MNNKTEAKRTKKAPNVSQWSDKPGNFSEGQRTWGHAWLPGKEISVPAGEESPHGNCIRIAWLDPNKVCLLRHSGSSWNQLLSLPTPGLTHATSPSLLGNCSQMGAVLLPIMGGSQVTPVPGNIPLTLAPGEGFWRAHGKPWLASGNWSYPRVCFEQFKAIISGSLAVGWGGECGVLREALPDSCGLGGGSLQT